MTVVYSPDIITSLKEIAKAFGVQENAVKKWEQKGAPIIKEGDGPAARYKAEKAALWEWYKMYAKMGPCTK